MFERSLLAATAGPRLQPAKLRLVTGAAAVHAALLVTIVVAQVWRIDAVPPPPEVRAFFDISFPDLGEPAPRLGTPKPPPPRTPVQAPVKTELVQPQQIEELTPADSGSSEESAATGSDLDVCDGCSPDGIPDGVPFGTGEAAIGGGDQPIEVWHPGSGIEPPVALHRVQPVYPRAAIGARREGVAIVVATIDASGAVLDATVVKDPGFGLGDAARDAVRQWLFRPALRGGRPIPVRYQLTVTFNLR